MGKLMAHLGNQGDEGDLETWQHGLENLAMWVWKLELGNFAMWIWKLGKVDLATWTWKLAWWIWKLGNLAVANRNLERKICQIQCFEIPIGMLHFWAIMQRSQ
jgi:hypothetical protein